MTNPIQQALHTKQQDVSFHYCFVRLRGGMLRTTTVKLFYTDVTKMEDFIARCQSFGEVKTVDFPEDQPVTDYKEYLVALQENRIVY